ncbi:MAG: phage tail protein [Shinella sp.]|uniref:phage tail protein n=1 Tax=Shinella sp. TaxID=1870904 RepID=UPI003C71017B
MSFLVAFAGAVSSFVGGLGIVGKLVLGIGLQLISAKMQKHRAGKQQQQAGGVQFERQYGENVPRQVACGLVGIAGHDCYVNTYGSANEIMQQLFVFSDFPCDGLSRIWAGGKELALQHVGDGYYSITEGDYANLIAFQWYDGTQTAANGPLIDNANPHGRWTSNHVGTGICYLIAFLKYTQGKVEQVPDFFFEIRGARLYDVRKDSTAGGVGPHRWGDYSTYEYSENPVTMEYNYCRGFSVNGDVFMGMEMSPVDLPVDRYAIAANICDEGTAYGARYRCSVIFDADLAHGDNIDAVMQSCGGIIVDGVDGSWPLIGTDQPIVETITDDDLISTETVVFQRFKSMADVVNSVSGTYPEPDNMWSPVGYDTQTNAAQVALDRRTRDFSLELPTVPSKAQANQLAAIYYKENRYEATAQIVVRPRFQTIKAGDWIRWNSKRYGDRVWMVADREIKALTSDGPRNVALSLVERDGAIYDPVGVLPPVIPFPPGEPVYAAVLPDYAIIPVIGTGSDGRAYPAFRLSWTSVPYPTVVSVEFQWRIKAEPTNIFSRTVAADARIAFVQEGIVSLTEYEFRYRLIVNGRSAPGYVAWVSMTSLDGGNADLEVGLGELKADVLGRFEDLQRGLDDTRPLLAQILTNQQLLGAVADASRRRLAVEVGQNRAAFDEQIVVMASELEAIAEQITDVTVAVDDRFAQGRVRFTAAADQTGALARFAVQLRVSAGDAWADSGFYLQIVEEGGVVQSEFAVMADRFVVINPGDLNSSFLPLVYENGELKLQIANIGLVRSGRLLSQNEKVDFDLNNGRLIFKS